MVNYEFAKVYKIIDNTNDNIYVGSTCEKTLALRLSKHVACYKHYCSTGNSHYITSFKIIENGNFDLYC